MTPHAEGSRGIDDLTSLHVRHARSGDIASVQWIITRFHELLMLAARVRLGQKLRRLVDPEDLVQEAWMVALPRLPDLVEREGRLTPVLIRFLTTTLLYKVSDVARAFVAGAGATGSSSLPGHENAWADVTRSALSRVCADESIVGD